MTILSAPGLLKNQPGYSFLGPILEMNHLLHDESILLIASPEIASFTAAVLGLEGGRVTTAASQTSGLRYLNARSFGLVLLELDLKGTRDWDILAAINWSAKREEPECPVVILTTEDDHLSQREAVRQGAAGVIQLPMGAADFAAAVHGYLPAVGSTGAVRTP